MTTTPSGSTTSGPSSKKPAPHQGPKRPRTIRSTPANTAACTTMILPVDVIRIGPYQREADNSHLGEMANWTGLLYTPIVVVERPDGSYWVVDGQHRLQTAINNGKQFIQVILIRTDELAGLSEAMLFALFDKTTKSLSAHDQYRALHVAGEAVTCHIEGILKAHGMTALGSTGPMCITAPATLRKVYGRSAMDFRHTQTDEQLAHGDATLTWIISAVEPFLAHGAVANRALSANLLGAFTWILDHADDDPDLGSVREACDNVAVDYLNGLIVGRAKDAGTTAGGSRAAWAGRFLAQWINDRLNRIAVSIPRVSMAGIPLITVGQDVKHC